MPTARTIINSALRRLGAVSTGEVPSAEEAQDGLAVLNDMIDAWSLETMMIIAEDVTTLTLTALKETYTVGSGGEIAINWPLQIDQCQLRVTSVTPNLDLPVSVLNNQQFAQIRLKTQQSTYIQALWLHTTYPLATLHVWPVPTQANDLVLWTKGIVGAFTDLDTNLNLGRGYSRALQYNLAVELAPEHGRKITAELAILANESKEIIKRSNSKPIYSTIDVPAGQGRDFGSYNWQNDEGSF